jgi:NitT/TauT family transport system substrate-binding protein
MPRSLRRAPFIAASSAFVAAPALVRAADTLNVGIVPGDGAGSAYYADQLGFFKNAGLDVKLQILANGPAIAAATTGGTLDIGGVNTGSLASARLRGVPLRAIAPTAVIGNGPVGDAIMVGRNSPIRTGADCNGKTIGTNALGTAQHAGGMAWIDAHGGDSKSVKFIEISVPAMAAAIEAGRIDGGVFSEPFGTLAQPGVRSLGPLYDTLRKPFLIFALTATEQWLARNGPVAARFAAAVRQAGVWANAREHEKERRQMNIALTKLEPAVIDKMILWEMGTSLDAAMIEPVIGMMVKYGFLERAVNPNDMVWRA